MVNRGKGLFIWKVFNTIFYEIFSIYGMLVLVSRMGVTSSYLQGSRNVHHQYLCVHKTKLSTIRVCMMLPKGKYLHVSCKYLSHLDTSFQPIKSQDL